MNKCCFYIVILLILSNQSVLAYWERMEVHFGATVPHYILVKDSCIYGASVTSSNARSSMLFVSEDNGSSWKHLLSIHEDYFQIIYPNGNDIFAGTMKQGILLSTNKGAAWKPINNGLADSNIQSVNYDGNTLYAGILNGKEGNLYTSDDYGQNWSKTGKGLEFYKSKLVLKVKDRLFSSETNTINLYYTTNNGVSWWNQCYYVGEASKIRCMKFFKHKNDYNFIMGTNSGIIISRNFGDTWRSLTKSLENIEIFDIGVYENFIFAGTYEHGIYVSCDYGETWAQMNDGLDICSRNVYSIGFRDGYVFIAASNGFFRSKLSDVLSDIRPKEEENDLTISPNPATEFININYRKQEEPEVFVQIYNKFGVNIFESQLINNTMNLTTEVFPSGIYYCKIKTGNVIETKKFVVIR